MAKSRYEFIESQPNDDVFSLHYKYRSFDSLPSLTLGDDVTATLLYLPVNFLIIRAALKEGLLRSYLELCILFLLGLTTFILFELIGPEVIRYAVLLCPFYYIVINKKNKNLES